MLTRAADLPALLLALGWIGWAAGVALAARHVAWRALMQRPELAAAPAAIVVLCLLWQWQAVALPGLGLHLIGATTLTLMFGWALAIIGVSLVSGVTALLGVIDGPLLGLTGALLGVVPVALSQAIRLAVERWLPANPFVFLFGTAFFGSWAVVVAVGATLTTLLAGLPAWRAYALWPDYFPAYWLLGFSEAWISGMVMTLLIVYRPQWVAAFNDKRYLRTR